MAIKLKMVTPERTIYDSEVEQITVMTQNGEISVLPNHIPLISVLQPGEMRVKKDGEDVPMAVTGGFIEIQQGSKVKILADSAERAEEIDVERAEEARKRAEEYLKEKKFEDDVEYAALQAQLERALSRIRIAKKYRKR